MDCAVVGTGWADFYIDRILDKIRLHAKGQLPAEYVAVTGKGDLQDHIFLLLGLGEADISGPGGCRDFPERKPPALNGVIDQVGQSCKPGAAGLAELPLCAIGQSWGNVEGYARIIVGLSAPDR